MGSQIPTRTGSRNTSSSEVLKRSKFPCHVSQGLPENAVTTITGITYDRQRIGTWLETGQVTCPAMKSTLSRDEHLGTHLPDQIPLPRPPLSITDVSALLSELSHSIQTGNLPSCFLLAGRIRSLATESKRNKRCFLSNGAAAALTTAFLRFPGEETLAALNVAFPLDDRSLTLLSTPELFFSLANIIDKGGLAARINAVRLLKNLVQFDVAVATAAMVNGMAEVMVNLMRDPVCEHDFRASLVAIFYAASTKGDIGPKYASLGLIPLLLDALVDCEKSTAEKISAVLDVVCDSQVGKLTIYENALAVPLLVKKILRISPITTELCVSVLWKLCKSDEENEGASNERAERCAVEALQVGVFHKLLLLLQIGCGEATKEKASSLLKFLNGQRKNVDCVKSSDFKSLKKTF